MAEFLQTLMQGLAVGSLYALIALGYTMVYGILKFINFAHSDVFVMGAWISFSVAMCAGFGPGEHASIAGCASLHKERRKEVGSRSLGFRAEKRRGTS
ncbi:hypothetical protein J4558_14095 [Leptolyngbya sp. 15MV]|nr:hypothetical protein J4558_14095 [Leptolyngbya sp. 15MV]